MKTETSRDEPIREVIEAELPTFVGSPEERARDVVTHFQDQIGPAHIEIDRASAILAEPSTRRWVTESISIAADAFPAEITYLEATAEALGTTLDGLFATQHRSLFPTAASSRVPADDDGCSVGASRLADGGAWIVKNRDNRPEIQDRHVVTRHVDPAWSGHALVATSTAGGPVATSGGINTQGLAMVSTAITAHRPPPGIHRTLLMGGLLASCGTVDEALTIIGALPHLGGTITMGDATGAIATVELEPDAILVERAGSRPWVARTNHTCSRSVSGGTEVASPEYRESSLRRLSRMQATMAEAVQIDQQWEKIEPWIARQMTDHGGEGAMCRHDGNVVTIATTIFTCDPPSMLTSIGPGCEGRWQRWTAAAGTPA
jgi:isopenicillin-N N-acyltransferase like protein